MPSRPGKNSFVTKVVVLQGPCQHMRVAVRRLGSCAVCAEDDLILKPKKVVLGFVHPTLSQGGAVAHVGAFRRSGGRADPTGPEFHKG